MSSFISPAALHRPDVSGQANQPELIRAIDKSVESYFEFHIYTKNGVSKHDKAVMTQRCIDLIVANGGEIREDWRSTIGLILYTMPPDVPNPVREDDPMFRDKLVTRSWNPYTAKEREIFGLNKK